MFPVDSEEKKVKLSCEVKGNPKPHIRCVDWEAVVLSMWVWGQMPQNFQMGMVVEWKIREGHASNSHPPRSFPGAVAYCSELAPCAVPGDFSIQHLEIIYGARDQPLQPCPDSF